MNTKNYSTHTKKYKTLISSVHSVYRLVSATYELPDLISRFARLLWQIFRADSCDIVLLDISRKDAQLRVVITDKKKAVITKKTAISNPLEKRLVRTVASTRHDRLLAFPMV
jgi:hypothetical protein